MSDRDVELSAVLDRVVEALQEIREGLPWPHCEHVGNRVRELRQSLAAWRAAREVPDEQG